MYKTCKLVLSVVANLAMYLQKGEFITVEEQESWRRCEDLLLQMLRWLCAGETLQVPSDFWELESSFGAYFLGFDNLIPDEFESDLAAVTRVLSDKHPPLLQHAQRLLVEDMLAYKPFLLYVCEFLKNNCEDTRFCLYLLQLLSFKAGSKVSSEALTESYSEAFNALRTWSLAQDNLPAVCELTLAFCRVHLGDKPTKQLKSRVLAEVSRRLYEDECYFKTQGQDLFTDATLFELCSLLIEFLQQQTEQASKPVKTRPSLALQGHCQAHYSEPETQNDEFCTYHRTGTEFELQHWYYCYTCDLVENKGACSVCARKCHRGHDVVYSRKGNFFCDCGDSRAAGGCQSLPKGKVKAGMPPPMSRHHFLSRMKGSDSDDQIQDFLSLSQGRLGREQELMFMDLEHDSNMYFVSSPHRGVVDMEDQDLEEIHSETEEEKKESDEKDLSENSEDDPQEKENDPSSSESSDEEMMAPPHEQVKQRTNSLQVMFGDEVKDLCTAECLTSMCLRTLSRLQSPAPAQFSVNLYTPKAVEVSKSQLQSVCSYKACNGPRLNHEDRDAKETFPSLKNAIAYCKPLDLILLAENNKLLLVDSSFMRASGNDLDRSQLNMLSKHTLTFSVTTIALNPANPRIAALHGANDCICVVLCDRSRRGLIKTKVTLALNHDQGATNPIVKIQWLPGSQCELAVATCREIKIFDLSKETLCPLFCYIALDNDITDLCTVSVSGYSLLLASSAQGFLYRQPINPEHREAGQIPISESIVLPTALSAKAIVAVSHLPALSCFALSLSDYKIVLAAMDPSFLYITSYFELALNADPAVALNFRHTSALVNMQVASVGDEVVLVGVARKTHSFPVLMKLTSETCVIAPLRKSSAYLDGVALYNNGEKDFILCHSEDGSILCLQVPKTQRTCEQPSTEVMNSWLQIEHLPESINMQTSFFERCVSLNAQKPMGPSNVTRGEVTLSGDPVLVFGNSKSALEKLSYDRNSDPVGLVSSVLPDTRTINLTIAVEGTSLLLAGVKCFVETGPGVQIEFLNRKFKLSPMKRWYDIPLCDAEIVKVHLQGKLNMRFVSTMKTPIKLIYFEVFAITTANFNLEQKLQDVAKAVLIATGGPEKASEYKMIYDWKLRQPLLSKCDKDQQLLIAQMLALVQVIPHGETSLASSVLLSQLLDKSLRSVNPLFKAAAKDAIRRLLEVQGKQSCYQLLKTLHLSWLAMTSSAVDEVLASKIIKMLSSFAKDNLGFFCYSLAQFPMLLTCLFDRVKAQKNTLSAVIEDLVRISIHSIQLIANKTVYEMNVTSVPEVLQTAYSLSQALFQEPCQVLCELLTNSQADIRRSAAQHIYKSLKKKNHAWLKEIRELSVMTCMSPFLDQSLMYKCENQELPDRVHALLSGVGSESQVEFFTPDISFTVLYWTSGLTPSPQIKIDSSVALTCRLLKALEKQWLREELVDGRYFERVAEVIVAQIEAFSVDSISEQQVLFLHLINSLVAYEGPDEDNHSRKISSRLLSVLLRALPKETILTAHQKITECMAYFLSGRGSIKAEYKGQVAVGVVESRDKLETVQADRDYLTENWDTVMDCKTDLYEELDQFLMVNLMDFVFNVVKGWKECPASPLKRVTDLIYPQGMQTTDEEEAPGLQQPWMDLFCSIFHEPVFTFARPATQRVFRLLFNSDADFHRALDSNQYSNELAKLVALASSTHFFQHIFQYDETVALTSSLRSICSQVCKRPLNWKLHFLDVNPVLDEMLPVQVLLRSAFHLPESTASTCLALVAVLFEETPEAESMLGGVIAPRALSRSRSWGRYTEDTLPLLIDLLLLENTWSSVRKAAGALIRGLLHFATESQSSSIVQLIFSRVDHLPPYGACTDVCLQVLAHILKHCHVPLPLQSRLLEDITRAVEKYSIVLDSQQNCEVYESLKDLLSSGSQCPGFSGYILEPEPCVRCFESQSVPFVQSKIQDLQAETKFSDCCQFIKFKDFYTISEISISIADARGHKAVRSCSVYINNRDVHDLTELKSNWAQWAKVMTVKVNPAASSVIHIEFAVPVTALNLVIEYQTINVLRAQPEENSLFPNKYFGRSRYTFISAQRFDSRGEVIGYSIGSEREVLPCPRCNKTVEDRHGICACGENVYQCIQCRNINYEKLDAFLCNECGVSRYCKMEISFMVRSGMACESILSRKDLDLAETKVEKLLEGIQAYFDGLEKVQDQTLSLVRKIQRVVPTQEKPDDNKMQPVLRALNPAVTTLAGLYAKDYKTSYQNMIKSVKNVNALRKEMLRFRKQDIGAVDRPVQEVTCYGCVHGFILNVLALLQDLDTPKEAGIRMVESVFRHCLLGPAREIKQAARKALHHLARKDAEMLTALHELINQHLTAVMSWGHFPVDVIREDIELVLNSCTYETNNIVLNGSTPEYDRWERTMKFFWKVFFLVLKQSWINGSLTEFIPGFLELILDMITKNFVLSEGRVEETDPELRAFIDDNPALRLTVESKTNGHDFFTSWVLNPDCAELHTSWQRGVSSFSAWTSGPNPSSPTLEIPTSNWLMECLLRSGSQKAQELSKRIFLSLAWTHSQVWRSVFAVVLAALDEALRTCHQGGDYYFALLESMVIPECPLSTQERGELLTQLFQAVEREVELLVKTQERQECMGVCSVMISLGHGLDCLLEFVTSLAKGPVLHSSKVLIHSILNSYLGIMKLSAIKNKVITESQVYLTKLFDLLREEGSETEAFLRDCVTALHLRQGDPLAQSLLCKLMLHIVNPERSTPIYYLHLDKSPTQEEFIRGNMEKNPYSSKELGPLMKNVRERICKELELTDPELLELLVAESIIGPELPITTVYERVLWPVLQQCEQKFEGKFPSDLPQEELPNMVVIYRLVGLDGEATENRIDSLPGDDDGMTDPELKYQATSVLSENIEGSSAMQDLLHLVALDREEFVQSALDVLAFSCKLRVNRLTLLGMGGANVLVNKLNDKSSNECLEKLLVVLESLVMDEQATQLPALETNVRQHVLVAVSTLQDRIERKSALTKSITRILPFLCYGSTEAMQDLYTFFKPFMQYEQVETLSSRDKAYFDAWVELIGTLSPRNHVFRSFLHEAGLTAYLCQLLARAGPEDMKARPQSARALLVSLASLMKGHPASQQTLQDYGLVAKAYHLSQEYSSSKEVGGMCEALVESIVGRTDSDPVIRNTLLQMIEQDKETKRDLAKRKQVEVLQELKGLGDIPAWEDVDEEPGLACVICQEGYTLRPEDLLGFYIYAKPVTVSTAIETPGADSNEVFRISALVTHFNCIHLSCHEQAARAERNMKKPKTEWEGATIRNQHTKCNNWFPIKGAGVSEDIYALAVERLCGAYENLEHRARNAVHDLRIMLHRFTVDESFSKDSKGGGPEHNLQVIPYMLQLSLHLLASDPAYNGLLQTKKDKFVTDLFTGLSLEQFEFCMCLMLLYISPDQWKLVKPRLVGVCASVAKDKSALQSKRQYGKEQCAPGAKPVLVLTLLVDLLFTRCLGDLPSTGDWTTTLQNFLGKSDKVLRDRCSTVFEEYRNISAFGSVEETLSALQWDATVATVFRTNV